IMTRDKAKGKREKARWPWHTAVTLARVLRRQSHTCAHSQLAIATCLNPEDRYLSFVASAAREATFFTCSAVEPTRSAAFPAISFARSTTLSRASPIHS